MTRVTVGTVSIQAKVNPVAGDVELTAVDACFNVIAAGTYTDPTEALKAVDCLRELYPDHTVKLGA